ncbi:Two-component sensor histidine kinase [Paracholeplasma brassicae]|uniref:histidine kinase n=1 Tax=Acholeplasma brassicae TaxID=61635 RepID=U4KMD0_9MOLU|nr:sensor histidine kinase [Paracholeplasma brassicae]CCV65196.1 Two-component sensor histidine kinase [Paracholeplasma brassicae]
MRQKHSIASIILISFFSISMIYLILLFSVTYVNFKRNITEVSNIQSEEISRQIVYNYESYINTIIDTSNLIQADITNKDIYASIDETSSYLNDVIRLKKEIITIELYDLQGDLIVSNIKNQTARNASQASWFLSSINEQTIHNFQTPFETQGVYQITISKFVLFNKNDQSGVLKIVISFDQFVELVKKSNLGFGGHISIIDQYYNTIYTSKTDASGVSDAKEKEVFLNTVIGTSKTKINDLNMMVNVDTLANTRWRIGVFINAEGIKVIENEFFWNTFSISTLFLFFAVLLFLTISRRIAKPIQALEAKMSDIEKEEFFQIQEVNIDSYQEVSALSHSFNTMMKKIDELMTRVVVEQKEQRKSELKALQNQINPHFLYNTLDSIVWMIEKEQNEQAAELVIALAKFFRLSISKGRNIIPIKDEIDHARNYILIQNIRYQNAFTYSFSCEDDIKDHKTMKFLLQPLIENSIYHGLKNRIDQGHIEVKVYQDEEDIIFSVSDNGYGMRQERIDELYRRFKDQNLHDGVGLKNIYQRLLIYFGSKAKMIIKSELDEGTTIEIHISKEASYEED